MSALKTEFGGGRGDLFQLAMKTGFLTALTFGLYRFWQTTRFRRWYWSAVRPGGTPMEYTGTGAEKFIGFLFAIILLALYLAFFNVVAMFITIRLSANTPGILEYGAAATPLALIPIIFMARYRARRYIMSRSRWRGIRFGMSAGAWGYAWRACLYSALAFLTLGLLWPLRTFQLEKYLTDRSWFGNARFTQFGSFWQLYGPLIPFLICFWGTLALYGYGLSYVLPAMLESISRGIPMVASNAPAWPFLVGNLGILLTFLFAIYYRVASFRVMAAMKTLGDGLEFDIHPRTRTLVRIHIIGGILTNLATSVAATIVIVAAIAIGMGIGISLPSGPSAPVPEPSVILALTLLFVISLVVIIVFYNVFRQIFITFPMVRHVAETLEIHEPSLLSTIRQRDRDDTRDAGGFAEALNVGGAF
ncbi:DUF898 family protein [Fontisubflavum oceani]|uniref:DUF898 family protein n=1 Tax=Fontisubflavum oceani TaxID=2978973 RepID=UPI0025B2CD34|nr:DUF898 family protein [Fontisubflavum oceani]WJY22868.1 DUF898 family protein [Fontisubflavum oceani]